MTEISECCAGSGHEGADREGIGPLLTPHARRAALRRTIEIVEQADEMDETDVELAERAGAALAGADQARGEDLAQAEDQSGALMGQELDAMLCDGDAGLKPCTQVRILTHDLAHPRDRVERRDAQEEQEQLGHAGQYEAGRSPAGSGPR